jgi:hypothetical protein
MNKEQFKKSILELINYYTGQMIQLNLAAKEAQDEQNEPVLRMIETQAQAIGMSFDASFEELLNPIFPSMGLPEDLEPVPMEELYEDEKVNKDNEC